MTNPDADSKDEKKSEANKKDEEVGSGEESSEGEEHLGGYESPARALHFVVYCCSYCKHMYCVLWEAN